MVNDIKTSIKAKLYDYAYTPFLSSVLIAWIILNHKYLLIYFSSSPLSEKLKLLGGYDFSIDFKIFGKHFVFYDGIGFWIPILFGLFYVYIYPMISKLFYSYTLKSSKKRKEIKQEIEDETPLTQEEAREIRHVINKSEEEKEVLISKLSELKKKYSDYVSQEEYKAVELKSDDLQTKLKSKEYSLNEIKKHNKELKDDIERIRKEFQNADKLKTELSESKIKINNLQSKLQNFEKRVSSGNNDTENSENAKTKIMRFFYDLNAGHLERNILISKIVESTKIKRPKVKLILDELFEKNILREDSIGNIGLTKDGDKILVEKFDSK